ncbi:MAG: helix-hairpin-helix domain-containing protein [Halococcoides sp.]
MTLLDRIKSLVGLGSKRSKSGDRDVEVTVEDSGPDQTTDGGSGSATTEEDPEDWGVPPGYDGDESEVQAGPEAFSDVQGAGEAESDDSGSTSAETAESSGRAGESSESDGATTGAAETDDEADWRTIDDEASSESPIEEAEPEPSEEGPELTEIKGIGPAYENRLVEAGVSSVESLIAADTSDLAESTDLSETRIQRWQERAESLETYRGE